MGISLETSIQFLKGVGEKRALLYKKLEVEKIGDLLYYFPRSYLDFSTPCDIAQAGGEEPCVLRAKVISKSGEQHIRKGLSVFKVKICDESGSLILSFFNSKYTVDALEKEREYLFYGRVSGYGSRREMSSPLIAPAQSPSFLPVYPLTQGLSSKMITSNVLQALLLLDETVPDPIPAVLRKKYGLCHLHYALQNIHLPSDQAAMEIARNRLIFEEFFILSLSLSTIKKRHLTHSAYRCTPVELSPFVQALPFALTGAQQRTIEEVCADLSRSSPMNRLVQGDVGSGKTMVAAAAAYLVGQNGFQSALMAPTEILATQHYHSLSTLLAPLGLRLALLTGSTPAKEKRRVKAALAAGEIDLCIGTHALLSEDVAFEKLALVITDEQQRFGVEQRAKLSEKSDDHPHLLVLSATPIPRTLALIVYGDLEVSVIDQLPPGRQEIQTFLITPEKKMRAYHFIQEQLDQGFQAYIVCPLVEAGEGGSGLENAEEYAETLAKGAFSAYRVGVLHGKMKARQKEAMMAAFASGEIQLLVSTTVIEVGVDVPNAVIMMIENAERFGLSQLHQLRGRVGRGKEKSSCILVSATKNEETRKRLSLLHQTNDGFKIAEFDLKTRGPGDFLGKRQHGLPVLKIADLSSNMDLLLQAQQAAQYAFDHKNELTSEERTLLNQSILRLMRSVAHSPLN